VTETARLPGSQGQLMHAMIRIGDSPLMLVDECPEWNSLGPKSLKGRSLRSARRPVRPSLVGRHAQTRREPGRDEAGDADNGRLSC